VTAGAPGCISLRTGDIDTGPEENQYAGRSGDRPREGYRSPSHASGGAASRRGSPREGHQPGARSCSSRINDGRYACLIDGKTFDMNGRASVSDSAAIEE